MNDALILNVPVEIERDGKVESCACGHSTAIPVRTEGFANAICKCCGAFRLPLKPELIEILLQATAAGVKPASAKYKIKSPSGNSNETNHRDFAGSNPPAR